MISDLEKKFELFAEFMENKLPSIEDQLSRASNNNLKKTK